MNTTDLLAAILAVALGSIVQAISGVGGGFIAVPLLAWIDLSLVPGPVVLGSISLSTIMAWHERKHIDLHTIPVILPDPVSYPCAQESAQSVDRRPID